MPDEMYVGCLENNCCKDFTRTLRCCRLLNKVKGMKHTRELCLRRRSQTGARKSLSGPTPGKNNSTNPKAALIIWVPSSGLELMSCGAERCSRGLETTGRPTNRRSSVGGSSQGRIRADRVFVRTEGGVSMSTLRFITVGETVYSASRVFVGSKDVSRLCLRSPTSSTTEEWLVSTRSHGRGIVSLSCRSEFRIAMDCAVDYTQAME